MSPYGIHAPQAKRKVVCRLVNNTAANHTTPDQVEFYSAEFALVPDWVLDRLMDKPAEVLRFYVWLNLRVIGKDRCGYKRFTEMAPALGVGESTVRRWVDILRKAGVVTVRRYPRKDGKRGQNVYFCPKDDPALTETSAHRVSAGADQGKQETSAHAMSAGQRSPGERSINPDTNSFTQTAEPLRGSPAAPAAPAAQPPLIPDEIIDGQVVDDRPLPVPAGAPLLPVPGALNAGVITREWVDYCARGGVKLANETIKRYAKAIKTAADEGFPEPVIRAALTAMARDRVIPRPSLFATYLARVQLGPELPPERMSRAQADRLRQTGDTPEDTAAMVAAFLAVPDPRKAPTA